VTLVTSVTVARTLSHMSNIPHPQKVAKALIIMRAKDSTARAKHVRRWLDQMDADQTGEVMGYLAGYGGALVEQLAALTGRDASALLDETFPLPELH
jgi:hypothetical protein